MTHICVSKLTVIGSDNGLSPGRRQAIIWTNAGILLIGPMWTNFSEILIENHIFSFKKMYSKMSSRKWHPFCLGLNVLIRYHVISSSPPICYITPFSTKPSHLFHHQTSRSYLGNQDKIKLGPHKDLLFHWASLQRCWDPATTHCKHCKHDDLIKWKHFPRNWSFVGRIHRSPSCRATREINTKITLEWVRKQFVIRVHTLFYFSWWCHQMETFSALLAICAGNSPVPSEFPAQRPVTWNFDVFFDLRLNKRLSKNNRGAGDLTR